MKISLKLFVIFLFFSIIIAGLGGIGMNYISNINKTLHVISQSNTNEMTHSFDVKYHIQRVKSNVRNLMLAMANNEAREVTYSKNKIKDSLSKIQFHNKEWGRAIRIAIKESDALDFEEEKEKEEEEEDLKIFVENKTLSDLFVARANKFVELSKENNLNRLARFYNANIVELSRQLQSRLEQQKKNILNELHEEFDEIFFMTKKITNILIFLTVALTILAILVGIMGLKMITRPIEALVHVVQEFGENDRVIEFNHNSKDEIGLLGSAFIEMTKRIKEKEAKLTISLNMQEALAKILKISLKKMPLSTILQEIIELIVSCEWLEVEPSGCIFLADNDSKFLNLMAHYGKDDRVVKACSRVSFGECLCGKVAAKKEKTFVNSCESSIHGENPHSHYCVPILSHDNILLGIMNVHAVEEINKNENTMDFFMSSSKIIAGIIQYKLLEEEKHNMQAELIDASKQAGMSEVATGVLHNVGNVLTSVNVAVDIITEKIANSVGTKFAQIVPLIEGKIGHLDEYFADDSKGQLVPKLLMELKEYQEEESLLLRTELKKLKDNIEHIKNIISAQQHIAGSKGLYEEVSLSKIIDQAIQINSMALERHDVRLIKKYTKDIIIKSDRLKILQIMINLISNSKYALAKATDKEIHITLEDSSDEFVQIQVIDNGEGIGKEEISRIFQYGYTTKKDGHGFGLHNSSLAAKDLKGELIVLSEGKDKGAIFTLRIPRNT